MNQQMGHLDLDSDGHLRATQDWSAQVAQELAAALGITLGDEHFAVITAARLFYEQFDHIPRTRPFIKYLQQELPELQLDNSKLQKLFNTGVTVREIARVAGLPKPAHCL